MEDNIDVNIIRENTLKQIHRDVDRAYKNRKSVNYDPETNSTSESIKESERLKKQFQGLSEDTNITIGDDRYPVN